MGFTIVFTYVELPFHAQVMRDGARLNLRCVERSVIDPDLRDRGDLLSASLTVARAEGIEQLFLEFEAAGAMFFRLLRRESWGASDFIVRDRDGNPLLFAGPAK